MVQWRVTDFTVYKIRLIAGPICICNLLLLTNYPQPLELKTASILLKILWFWQALAHVFSHSWEQGIDGQCSHI